MNKLSSARSGHTSRGKWSEAGVPKIGWRCIGIEDLEEPSRICEMCESIEIRYVHNLEHPDYSETLAVGCVCAERMEQNYVQPREREKRLKNSARRRKNWINRNWKISAKGNSYLRIDGFNITISKIRGGTDCIIIVVRRKTNRTQVGRRKYPTEEAAKAASFDALTWAKSSL